MTTIACSWCGMLNAAGGAWCGCGHRADQPRLRCDCVPCLVQRIQPAGSNHVVEPQPVRDAARRVWEGSRPDPDHPHRVIVSRDVMDALGDVLADT